MKRTLHGPNGPPKIHCKLGYIFSFVLEGAPFRPLLMVISSRALTPDLNYVENVRSESKDHYKHMELYFLSAIITKPKSESDLPEFPAIEPHALKVKDFLPTIEEVKHLIVELVPAVASVCAEQFLFLSRDLKDLIEDLRSRRNSETPKSNVYCLGALPVNESKYQDDVKILEYYQEKVVHIMEEADMDVDNSFKVTIGGDLLTAERFIYAKMLRLGNRGPDAFVNLGPVVFEFLHSSK